MVKKTEERMIRPDAGFMGEHKAAAEPAADDEGDKGDEGDKTTADPTLGPDGKPMLTPAAQQMAKDNF